MPFEPVPPATVLIVDDEPVISRLVVHYLRHRGFRVLDASSGEAALTLVRERRPPIDLVLTEVDMPGMRGTELAGWMFTECPGPQVLLMTAGVPSGSARISVQGHLVRLLRKPLDLDRSVDLIHAMLEPFPAEAFAEAPRLAG